MTLGNLIFKRGVSVQPITVLVVDDYEPARKAFRELLEQEEGIQVIGEAADGREAIAKYQELHPQVILMDVKMPRMNGITATGRIKKQSPEAKVIILSAYDEKDLAEKAMNLGASAYLTKNQAVEDIIRTILNVCKKKPQA